MVIKTKKKVNSKSTKKKGAGLGDIAQKAIEKSGVEAHMLGSILPPKRYSFCG